MKKDSFEAVEKQIVEDTIENYRALCKGKFLTNNWVVLDGRKTEEEIQNDVCANILSSPEYNRIRSA